MKHRILALVAAVAALLSLNLVGASTASAVGKASIYDCTNRTITSDRHSMSVVCNPPGKQYRFEVYCGWYSAGQGGAFWRSSAWTKDGSRATVNCGGGAYVAGVGSTVYYS